MNAKKPPSHKQHREQIAAAACADDLPDRKPDGTPYAKSKAERWKLVVALRDEVVKARNRKAQSEAQNRPEVVARRSAAMKASHARPEVKARLSAAAIEREKAKQ